LVLIDFCDSLCSQVFLARDAIVAVDTFDAIVAAQKQ